MQVLREAEGMKTFAFPSPRGEGHHRRNILDVCLQRWAAPNGHGPSPPTSRTALSPLVGPPPFIRQAEAAGPSLPLSV